MLKGLILSLSIVLVLFLAIIALEYLAWSDVITRTVLFYTFIFSVGTVLVVYILIPWLKLLRIGHTISHREAAALIGAFFPEVSDKLLNTLQLHDASLREMASGELSLIEASIEQRASQLNPVPFRQAIDLKKNKRYLRYFLPPLLLLIVILFISPAFVTEPSKRIVNHSTAYERPLPYELKITNAELQALQHEDFVLQVIAEGDEIPADVQLIIGNLTYRMQESHPGNYSYTFKDLNGDVQFRLATTLYTSKDYLLKVFPKPVIYSFDIVLDFPDYLHRKNEVIENSGDIVVPEGTDIKWNIYTKDAEQIFFTRGDSILTLESKGSNVFHHTEKANRNFYYSLRGSNQYVASGDSMNFAVQVTRDEYPTLSVSEERVESFNGFAHYDGVVSDDHGFHTLRFFYQKRQEEDWRLNDIKIDKTLNRQYFSYTVQLEDFGLSPGESLRYYFEVRDNDVINGFKRTKSPTFELSLPDADQLEEQIAETSEKIKDSMEDAMSELDRINQEIEKVQMSLMDKKELDWMDKKQLSDLFQKQESLQDKISQLEKMNQEINQVEDFMQKQKDEELTEKMEELQSLMEELADEDLEKQLEELQKKMEELDKDNLNRQLDQIKKNNEDLKSNLEQNLELYKQLEYEKMINDIADDLSELAEEQMELSRLTEEKEIDEEKSLEEQNKTREQFSDIEKELDKAESLNQQLEEPFDVEVDPQTKEDINMEMDNASSELEKGRQKKAAKSQQNAGSKMEQMASNLRMMMQGAMENRMAEDAEMIKRMLDNLLDLSFSTEGLMKKMENTSQNDPGYIDNIDQMKLLQDDFSIVHDSLIALSKRQIMVKPFIVRESDQVIGYMDRSLNSLQDRKVGQSLGHAQYAMTSMNNLALMLDESLDQMQMSLSMGGSGQGQQCPMPGQGETKSMEEMSEMQKQLNEGMSKGMKQEGNQGENGINSDSERLARMAETQGEIRRMLQQYLDELESQGGNGNALNKLLEEMQKSEEDIINRRITQETLERQKNIEVRLLQSEKAEQQRERENRRESTSGKDRERGNLNDNLEYKDSEMAREEILITEPIEMAPFYRELLKKYLYNLQKDNAQE